ncbi:MAG: hypothetical protein IJT59_04565 [Desulfovibrionaceae bacterium]|nr:hypothetical protein [Desulfovibrionaceae bacterium]
MATSNSSLTAVERNTDFAAELLLNRVMNGQLETSKGKTINGATRHMATCHDATAYTYGVLAENVAYGKTIVEGTQNALTELVDQVKKIRNIYSTDDSSVFDPSVTSALKSNIDSLLATEIEGVTVLGNSGRNLTLGIEGNEQITIGKANVNNSTAHAAFHNFYDELSRLSNGTSTSTSTQIRDLCDKAMTDLYGEIATQGQQWNILDNRYTMFNEMVSSYHQFSDEQAVNMGGSMSVLDAFS